MPMNSKWVLLSSYLSASSGWDGVPRTYLGQRSTAFVAVCDGLVYLKIEEAEVTMIVIEGCIYSSTLFSTSSSYRLLFKSAEHSRWPLDRTDSSVEPQIS